jgi:hypothetical protein
MFMPSAGVPSASFTYPRMTNPGPGPSVGWIGLGVEVGVEVRVSSTVWVKGEGVDVSVRVGCGGITARVDVCVAVGVSVSILGTGVREGIPVSTTLVEVGRGVAGGRDARQALKARTKIKSKCLNIMIS